TGFFGAAFFAAGFRAALATGFFLAGFFATVFFLLGFMRAIEGPTSSSGREPSRAKHPVAPRSTPGPPSDVGLRLPQAVNRWRFRTSPTLHFAAVAVTWIVAASQSWFALSAC